MCVPCDARRAREWQRDRRVDPIDALWRRARDRAKKAGDPFRITAEDVQAAWPADGRCPILGLKLERKKRGPQDASPSLDKLNPAWPYEPGNIAVISHAANRAKGNMRAADLEKIVVWMREQGLD